ELIQYRQPDGTTVNIRIQGDEHSHLILSEDNYLILPQNNGTFCFATLDNAGNVVPSSISARNPDERNSATLRQLTKIDKESVKERAIKKLTQASSLRLSSFKKHNSQERTSGITHKAPGKIGLFPGASYPTVGNPKALVILVEYADVKFNVPDPHAYFSGLLNKEGFSEYGATGSASEWFADNSAGKFKPEFDVYGPVKLSAKRSYYGGNNNYGNDLAPQKMAVEACNVLDKDVDFSVYDTDGDGYIDNVFIFYAGTGENRTGELDAVWPHTSWVTELEFPNHVYDGVILDRYACSNEWLDGVPDGIGTFCHEFSHVMGLPDLYHTALGSMAYTPGNWSVMDYGPYLNNSHTPPLYSSFERLALGWLAPEELTDDKSYALPELAANKAYSVTRGNGTEFFLFENRQNRGWDKYLPGHGMLVWRVDYNADVWDKRAVNN
ncbi:MAG: M6 family metalloprotease domain-containing protein, partial [Muribaculaceae bacterium]|nr:M6 family metalloprotease domain-containing protein [Muribaculaceae bacterium]